MPTGIYTRKPNQGFQIGFTPWNKGKTSIFSELTLEKMSNSHLGRSWGNHTEKAKERIRKSHLGEKNGMFGKPSFWRGKKMPIEMCRKLSERMRGRFGPLSNRWIADRSKLAKTRNPRGDSIESILWARNIKKRDNWTCKRENEDCKGRLEAHHILSYRNHTESRYDINNGITLCQFHHPRKRVDEQRLIPFFRELVKA